MKNWYVLLTVACSVGLLLFVTPLAADELEPSECICDPIDMYVDGGNIVITDRCDTFFCESGLPIGGGSFEEPVCVEIEKPRVSLPTEPSKPDDCSSNMEEILRTLQELIDVLEPPTVWY